MHDDAAREAERREDAPHVLERRLRGLVDRVPLRRISGGIAIDVELAIAAFRRRQRHRRAGLAHPWRKDGLVRQHHGLLVRAWTWAIRSRVSRLSAPTPSWRALRSPATSCRRRRHISATRRPKCRAEGGPRPRLPAPARDPSWFARTRCAKSSAGRPARRAAR